MKHSISAERMWQRCRRQYFFSEIMANANANDPKRKEAQFLRKVDSVDTWIGNLVHGVIEHHLVPALQNGFWPSENEVIYKAIDLARRQFSFSATGQYHHISKENAGDEYCVLQEHYFADRYRSETDIDEVTEIIAQALSNLLQSRNMKAFLMERKSYAAEKMLWINVDGVSITAKLDLAMPFHDLMGLDIVDWKVASRVSNYNYQVAVYALAALNNDTLPYFSLARTQIRGHIINLLDDDPSDALEKAYYIDDEAIFRTENMLFERIEQIRALRGDKRYQDLEISTFALAESDGTCALCSWQELCLEMENDGTSQPLPSLKPKTTQLELPFDGDW
ncbi:PD-(D/E)XK nuclease family protein [Patescibacteria group bacterium]|nr:PD-(D/E)XK nuclease family protein [Patescibacteria group bacterium]